MTPEELYEATRGIWVIGRKRERAELALAVYQGIVREAYRIERWHPAGTLEYRTRDAVGFRGSGRWEFEGHVAYDVRDRYLDGSVGKGGQNPVRYVNFESATRPTAREASGSARGAPVDGGPKTSGPGVVRRGTGKPTAQQAEIREAAILITLNQLYRSDMTSEELYEATRGFWVIGPRRARAILALAVYQGIVREVYQIERWLPAGTLAYRTRDAAAYRGSGRWEFEGRVAHDVRDRYVGRSVGRGGQNPIRYLNC